MKKIAIIVAMVAMVGLIVSPVWASDRPALDRTIQNFYEKQGEAVPQAYWGYLYDLVTNAASSGWGSIYVLTNYDPLVRNHIVGILVPKGANPGDEILIDQWLNPYEVVYLNLSTLGLGDENAWSLIWSNMFDFGSGVLLYCTNSFSPGVTYEKGWWFYTP